MAILAADVAGYSRLMASDERSTIATLDAARETFRLLVAKHLGRVVDTAGDSVLAVFDTASGAVDAAMTIQEHLATASLEIPADRRMRFRIGVHVGDVIEKPDGSVYGNGVNVAARLQALAAPGGIVVSEAVRSSLGERVGRNFEDAGHYRVKNIADPVHAYRLSAVPGEFCERRTAQFGDTAGASLREGPVRPGGSPTNLPAELLPLYGRDSELAAICDRIETHRLVTIVGTAGMGKTRLAQAAARRLCDRYTDGAWMIQLSPLTDGASLPAAAARALGVRLNGERRPCDELAAALEAQRVLLVLDNCEHLLDAAATLVQTLVDRAPGTTILVTSQAPLGLADEQQYRLEPLAVPQASNVEPLLDYGAVRLLIERVTALDRHFVLDVKNRAAAVDICRQLDGLPLAIELAAARIPLLGMHGVRERLADRLQLLTSGQRSSPARHQTLRAALEWSHALLDDVDQVVFRRLAVFRGGFTVEAAQSIACDAQVDEWAVLESLGTLVDRSLVLAEGDGRRRMRLLDSMRAYAAEKLVEASETAIWKRHAEYFANYFETSADALYAGTLTEGAFIQARELELDNLRAALDASLSVAGDAHTALRVLVATAPMCHLLSLQEQAARWLRVLSQRIEPDASPRQAALCRYAWIHWGQSVWWSRGNWPDWRSIAASPLDALGDARRQAHALCVQALQLSINGDFEAAYSALDEAGELEAPTWPAWLRTRRRLFRAGFDREAGHPATEPSALNDALIELESAGEGDGRWAFLIRTDLAIESLFRDKVDEAVQGLRQLVDLGHRQRQDSIGMCPVLAWLAFALAEHGKLDDACEVALEGAQHLKRSGLWPRLGPTFALLAAKRGHAGDAARMIGAIDAHSKRSGARRPRVLQRVRDRTLSMIEETHPKPQVDIWLSEGAALDGDAFARLVIESLQ